MPIRILAYDASWPQSYRREKSRLLAALSRRDLRIKHIGSTAVPGLSAKPVIDLMLGFPSRTELPQVIPDLRALGYQYHPEFQDVVPERLFCSARRGNQGEFHLHLAVAGGRFWQERLLFRNSLRQNGEIAAAYCRLKRQLAARFGHDRRAYSNAKSGFIALVLAAARAAEEMCPFVSGNRQKQGRAFDTIVCEPDLRMSR